MAKKTFKQHEIRNFSGADAQATRRAVTEARAIMRTLVLAAASQQDGSTNFDDPGAGRWFAAVDVAVAKVATVRDTLIESRGSPNADWATPLALLESLSSALWHSCGQSTTEPLDLAEFEAAAEVAIERLAVLLDECEGEVTPV